MNIVVEGPDNSGKSTLVECITRVIGWPVISSAGPCKDREEFNARAAAFLGRDRVIFDRHCIVSERIYGMARGQVMLDVEQERMFYSSSTVLIYCRVPPALSMEGHVVKEHDKPDHLLMLEAKRIQIRQHYDLWGLEHAHLIHRKGDTPHRIVRFLMGELNK